MDCNNKYNTFDNNKFCYYITSTFDNRHYLIPRYAPKAHWYYADTVNITFNLYECDVDVEDLKNITSEDIVVTFYNNRFEQINPEFTVEIINNEQENLDSQTPQKQFVVSIDYENSCKYFLRGTYYCRLQLVSYNDSEEETETPKVSTMATILPANRCCFYVV